MFVTLEAKYFIRTGKGHELSFVAAVGMLFCKEPL